MTVFDFAYTNLHSVDMALVPLHPSSSSEEVAWAVKEMTCLIPAAAGQRCTMVTIMS